MKKKYYVRKQIEYGCKIYGVFTPITNVRVNYFASYKDAASFAERLNK